MALVSCYLRINLPIKFTLLLTLRNINVYNYILVLCFFSYFEHVKSEGEKSQVEALHEEFTTYESDEEIEVTDEDGSSMTIRAHPGMDIETDARHGWRKNAKDTSVVALGCNTHKVVRHEHVTRADDRVAQRHELIGTKRIYGFIEDQGYTVNIHVHDRNMSINKWIRENTNSTNQNDTWHGVKSLKIGLNGPKGICSGPRYKHGKTWHKELHDKLEPLCTHAHWSIRNSNGDSQVLRDSLVNAVEHYKGNHAKCSINARCQNDPQYDPSTVLIESQVAEKLLREKLTGSIIYKHAEDFRYGKDTYHTESFNNTVNMFQDKRIAFGDMQYSLRSYLAVLHWNENVGREYTSIHNPPDPNAPRSKKGKKRLIACSFNYRNSIWRSYMDSVFTVN